MSYLAKTIHGKDFPAPESVIPTRLLRQCGCGNWYSISKSYVNRYQSCSRGCVSSKAGRPWSQDETDRLKDIYEKANQDPDFRLYPHFDWFGRDHKNIARKARELGLTNKYRKKVKVLKVQVKVKKYKTPEERLAAASEMMKKRHSERGHPMLGKKHTKEALQKVSQRAKKAWADPNSGHNSESVRQMRSDNMLKRIASGKMRAGYSRAKGGKREDLGGVYFRSSWEANYARYLNFLVEKGEIAGWEYEAKTFIFEKIKRGTRAYTPDFKILKPCGGHEWHEVKGWMDDKSKTRLARMGRYFPEEKVVIIDHAWFKSAGRQLAGLIKNWESGTVH